MKGRGGNGEFPPPPPWVDRSPDRCPVRMVKQGAGPSPYFDPFSLRSLRIVLIRGGRKHLQDSSPPSPHTFPPPPPRGSGSLLVLRVFDPHFPYR